MQKAAKEAKVHTSWIDPNAGYDDALSGFVTAVLADQDFVADLERFLAEHRLVERGRVNSLAQTALLLTCPGVPDLYQGTEVWDLSLVDPDNRRPVDYQERRRLLDLVVGRGGRGPEAALARSDEGGPKLWLIHRVLGHRRWHPDAYGPGSGYEPLHVGGPPRPARGGLRPYRRAGRDGAAAGRQPGRDWAGTTVDLPDGDWIDVLTGEQADGGDAGVPRCCGGFPSPSWARQS